MKRPDVKLHVLRGLSWVLEALSCEGGELWRRRAVDAEGRQLHQGRPRSRVHCYLAEFVLAAGITLTHGFNLEASLDCLLYISAVYLILSHCKAFTEYRSSLLYVPFEFKVYYFFIN